VNRSFAVLLCCAIVVAAPLRAQTPADRLAGDVVALDGNTLRLRLNTGQALAVALPADARISGRAPAEPADIAPGAYVGATTTPQADGTLLASEVHIFPASMRGTGEGHYPMPSTPGSMMTNATVASVDAAARGGSTMTNASVAAVAGSGSARTMTLKYRGGEQVITVPAGIPIVMVEAAERKEIVPGAHVIVSVTHGPGESLVANRVTVGLRGFVPAL
jgi:hypothetical protein